MNNTTDTKSAWTMLAPALIMVALFIVFPFFMSIYFSFTDQRLVPNLNVPTEFVGFRNYVRLFEDGAFQNAFFRTATFTILVVPLQCAMGLAAALLINSKLPMRNAFRTIYFLPTVISMVVVSVIWASLYQTEGFSPSEKFNRLTGCTPNISPCHQSCCCHHGRDSPSR
jgi:multiple sugar transport system permease protein